MTTALTPYLFFGGRCDEAIEFYRQALDAKLIMRMGFNESPEPVPEGMLQPGFETKVMHASLQVGETTVYMADGCDDKSKLEGFMLALTVANEQEAHRMFDALAAGGTMQMPLCKTFWSPCYGMVTDRFKVGWMVMVPGEMP